MLRSALPRLSFRAAKINPGGERPMDARFMQVRIHARYVIAKPSETSAGHKINVASTNHHKIVSL